MINKSYKFYIILFLAICFFLFNCSDPGGGGEEEDVDNSTLIRACPI